MEISESTKTSFRHLNISGSRLYDIDAGYLDDNVCFEVHFKRNLSYEDLEYIRKDLDDIARYYDPGYGYAEIDMQNIIIEIRQSEIIKEDV